MVKRGSSTFSAASVAKGSVVLSRSIEKNLALEAEVSRLRHHVSVLSGRLHFVTLERDGLQDMVIPTMKFEEFETWECSPPAEEVVAGEEGLDGAAPSVAGMSDGESHWVAEEERREGAPSVAGVEVGESHDVAGKMLEDKAAPSVAGMEVERGRGTAEVDEEWEENTTGGVGNVETVPEMAEDCNRFKMDLVEMEDWTPDPPVQPINCDRLEELKRSVMDAVRETRELNANLERVLEEREVMRRRKLSLGLESSRDEDAILGGVIVVGGASQKAKNTARKKKRKNR